MGYSEENARLFDLLKKARFGCQESMNRLALCVQNDLFVYIYRLTLNYEVAEDIKQETLLEMVKSLKDLKHLNCFRPWLFRTALSKVQRYFRDQQRERSVKSISIIDAEKVTYHVSAHDGGGLKKIVDKELSQAVLRAMAALKLLHRNILILRCYEELSYLEIAEVMNCSEKAAQVLFFRAKLSLRRRLAKRGFNRNYLLGALGLFGCMTSTSQAAPVVVSAPFLEVSTSSAVIGFASTKMGIAAMCMAATIAVTSSVMLPLNRNGDFSHIPDGNDITSSHAITPVADNNDLSTIQENIINPGTIPLRKNVKSFLSIRQLRDPVDGKTSRQIEEQWNFFPDGIDKSIFTLLSQSDPNEKPVAARLQNASGNYRLSGDTIYIGNSHFNFGGKGSFPTHLLPTDPPGLWEFLRGTKWSEHNIRDSRTGLLTKLVDSHSTDVYYNETVLYNVANREFFESFPDSWPTDASIVDERDVMHKRGWTYFRVSGRVNGQDVSGKGRIPFIYNELSEHSPWLELNVGSNLIIVDKISQAYAADGTGKTIASCPAGSFMKGLNRPWMGMHTIDIIRRDAAEKRIRFATKHIAEEISDCNCGQTEITLFCDTADIESQIVYTVDMDKDVIEQIMFKNGSQENVLQFTYLQEIAPASEEFAEPAEVNTQNTKYLDGMGILWLMELTQGTFGKSVGHEI